MNKHQCALYGVRFVLGPETFVKIFPDEDFSAVSEDTLFAQMTDLSKNQRIALLAYLYLYIQLEQRELQIWDNLRERLSVPPAVRQNMVGVVTADRIAYILQDLSKEQSDSGRIFTDPPAYVMRMIEDVVAAPIQEAKRALAGLNAAEYEHPTDRAALEKLNGNAMLAKVFKLYSEYNLERMCTIQYTGSCLKVTEDNLPYLHHALLEACRVLEITDIPPLYLQQGFINAFTTGANHPLIVLEASCLSLLDYDELLFLLGHELGHIKSQHVMYHSIATILPYIGEMVGNLTFGIGDLVSSGLSIALYNWFRKSEFTADRAGLLVCQNVEAAVSVMAKISGFPPRYYQHLDTDQFLQQAYDFQELDSSKYNKVMKLISVMYQDHPWTVMRAHELKQWVDSEAYERILKRTADAEKSRPLIAENQSAPMFCPQCGAPHEPEARFCRQCGTRLQ